MNYNLLSSSKTLNIFVIFIQIANLIQFIIENQENIAKSPNISNSFDPLLNKKIRRVKKRNYKSDLKLVAYKFQSLNLLFKVRVDTLTKDLDETMPVLVLLFCRSLQVRNRWNFGVSISRTGGLTEFVD